MGKEIDPSDIGKYPEIIKKAQTEITKMDVLVCGHCNNVFHFVEQFREHKGTRCTKAAQQKDNLETRPVIWSFLLWKASQLSQDQNKDQNNLNAWRLYQSWMKLDEAIKETWVVAGRTIQSFAKIGQGNLQEMPVKITKTVVGNSPDTSRGKQQINNRLINKPPPPSAKELDASFNELKSADAAAKRPLSRTVPAKPIANRPPPKVGILARKALRTIGTNADGIVETDEHNIEKILAKRFNPRQKEHEYLIKWENILHEQNTWEPVSHLETCPVLLDTFEKQLARQKEQRLAAAAKQAQAQHSAEVKREVPRKDDSQSEDDSGASGIKRRKLDSSGITVKPIVRNEPIRTVVAAKQVKANGLPATPIQVKKGNEKSAEVVITDAKDGKPTGIVKKTGVTINPQTKNEAQIKVIPKGGDSVSGVVRVSAAPAAISTPVNRVVQKLGNTTVKPVQSVHRGGVVTKAKLSEMERAASAQHLASVGESHIKPTITRVVKSAPNSKNVTPEQKIAALTRQGNLKITRKVVGAQQANAQPILIQESEEYALNDSFPLSIVPKVEENQTQIHIGEQEHDLLGQVMGHVQGDGSSIALVNAGQVNQNELHMKKESDPTEELLLAHQQQQQQLIDANQLQQQGIVTDQNGLQQILAANDDGTQQLIQFVTGEDGTIYQVAGKNEQGQTILIAQGADGEQQCVYVAADDQELLGADESNNGGVAIDGNLVDANAEVQQQLQQQLIDAEGQTAIHYAVEGDEHVQGLNQQLQVATEDADSQDGQITAEVVQADLPSPGMNIEHILTNALTSVINSILFFRFQAERDESCYNCPTAHSW